MKTILGVTNRIEDEVNSASYFAIRDAIRDETYYAIWRTTAGGTEDATWLMVYVTTYNTVRNVTEENEK